MMENINNEYLKEVLGYYNPTITNIRLTPEHLISTIKKEVKVLLPKKYIINKNACILFWENGEKTIVKRCEEDEFNPRLAFLTAFFQKYCRNEQKQS